jgi:hypothetical protein
VFLCGELFKLLKVLMGRLLKQTALRDATTVVKLTKIDLTKEENYVEYGKIDVGFAVENELKRLIDSKIVTDRQVLDFRMKCKSWIKSTISKLMQKTAVKYSLARHMEFLDPRKIKEKDRNREHLKAILTLLVQCNRLCDREVDAILDQYNDFVDEVLADKLECFIKFKPEVNRLDQLLFEAMASNDSYVKLWNIVRMLLVLSHGQASVERGFSVNAQIEVENLTESTFKARRVICDYVDHVGGIENIDVSNKKLIIAVAAARTKYMAYLEEQKVKTAKEEIDKSNKRLLEEIDELKVKKARLKKDVDALEVSADKLAEKAEQSHSVTCISKSNSLRRTAKQKTAEIQVLELQLEEKLQHLKDS